MIRKLLLAALLLALIGRAGPAGAQGGSGWQQVPGMPTFVDVFGVEQPVEMDVLGMVDAYNGWGISSRRDFNAIYRLAYRDGRWTAAADGGTPGGSVVIEAVSADEAWLLGGSGFYHRTAAGWKLEQRRNPDEALSIYDIELSVNGAAGWAVGEDLNRRGEAVLLALRDGRWQRDASVSGAGVVVSVSIDEGSGTGWAAGDSLWRYEGGTWKRAAQPDLCGPTACAIRLGTIQAPSEREAWALACADQCADGQFVLHYRDGAWSEAAIERPAGGTLSLSGLAVNRYGAGLLTGGVRVDGWWTRSVMYRLAGGQWVAEPLPTTAKGEPVDILLDLSVLDTGH
ncbi:MAG TPA: hypothetical protein VGE07_23920, partial [Herpetosiphonaceae bacterium]